jgi:ketosteroid isomerase-like protein
VRSFYDAFARRDARLFTELLDPQIEWTSAENFLYADQSPYVGKDAVLKLIFERLPADWDDFSVSAGEVLGGGDLVIANGRFLGRFKANRALINAQFVQVFQFNDGKIAKCQMYTDTAQFKESISRIRLASV